MKKILFTIVLIISSTISFSESFADNQMPNLDPQIIKELQDDLAKEKHPLADHIQELASKWEASMTNYQIVWKVSDPIVVFVESLKQLATYAPMQISLNLVAQILNSFQKAHGGKGGLNDQTIKSVLTVLDQVESLNIKKTDTGEASFEFVTKGNREVVIDGSIAGKPADAARVVIKPGMKVTLRPLSKVEALKDFMSTIFDGGAAKPRTMINGQLTRSFLTSYLKDFEGKMDFVPMTVTVSNFSVMAKTSGGQHVGVTNPQIFTLPNLSVGSRLVVSGQISLGKLPLFIPISLDNEKVHADEKMAGK